MIFRVTRAAENIEKKRKAKNKKKMFQDENFQFYS